MMSCGLSATRWWSLRRPRHRRNDREFSEARIRDGAGDEPLRAGQPSSPDVGRRLVDLARADEARWPKGPLTTLVWHWDSHQRGQPDVSKNIFVDGRCALSPASDPSERSLGSIKYLDDRELQRLFEAVNAEIARRDLIDPGDRRAGAAGSTPSLTADLSATLGKEKTKRDDKIPAGKVSLIRASFEFRMKPAAIARALRVSQSSVRGVLSSAAKASNPKRRT